MRERLHMFRLFVHPKLYFPAESVRRKSVEQRRMLGDVCKRQHAEPERIETVVLYQNGKDRILLRFRDVLRILPGMLPERRRLRQLSELFKLQ